MRPGGARADAGIAFAAAPARFETQQHQAQQHQDTAQQIGRGAAIDRLELVDDGGGEGVEAGQVAAYSL